MTRGEWQFLQSDRPDRDRRSMAVELWQRFILRLSNFSWKSNFTVKEFSPSTSFNILLPPSCQKTTFYSSSGQQPIVDIDFFMQVALFICAMVSKLHQQIYPVHRCTCEKRIGIHEIGWILSIRSLAGSKISIHFRVVITRWLPRWLSPWQQINSWVLTVRWLPRWLF